MSPPPFFATLVQTFHFPFNRDALVFLELYDVSPCLGEREKLFVRHGVKSLTEIFERLQRDFGYRHDSPSGIISERRQC